MDKLSNVFGENVFNDAVMRARLPKATYKALKKTLKKEGYVLVGEENDGQVKYAGEKTELTLRYDSEQNTLVIRITTSS